MVQHALDVNSGVVTGSSLISGAGEVFAVPVELRRRPFRYVAPRGSGGTHDQVGTEGASAATTTSGAIGSADLRSSMQRNNAVTTATNTIAGMRCLNNSFIRGNLAGVGGFYLSFICAWTAFSSDCIFFVGATASARAGGNDASALANSVCFGADPADSNITLISVDSGGAITKSSSFGLTKANLLTGDPATSGPRVFNFVMSCLPNDSKIVCSVYDMSNNVYVLDPTSATATITATLPLATTPMRWWSAGSTDVTAATSVSQDFMAFSGYW